MLGWLFIDIFISRRCYPEKKADVTRKGLCNICENESVWHLCENDPVSCGGRPNPQQRIYIGAIGLGATLLTGLILCR